MADYYTILKKTIGSLPENTGATRRSVYSRARNAIVNQLKAYEPPLSPSEITAEQLRLEEAIRKVEAEAARESLGLGPAAKPASAGQATTAASGTARSAQAPKTPASPLKKSVEQAEQLGAASHKAVQSTREAMTPEAEAEAPSRKEPVFASEGAGARAPQDEKSAVADEDAKTQAKQAEGAPSAEPAAEPVIGADQRKGRSRISDVIRGERKGLPVVPIALFAVLVLIVLGIVGVIYSQKDLFSEMVAGGPEVSEDGAVQDSSAGKAGETEPTGTQETDSGAGTGTGPVKNTDRLLDGNGQPAAAPDARTVTTTTITPGAPTPRTVGEGAAPEGGETTTPKEPEAPAETVTPSEAPESVLQSGETQDVDQALDDVASEGEQSILYEEGTDEGGAGTASKGKVVWSLEDDRDLDGGKLAVLTASVTIPERDVTVDIRIKPNDDSSLPASHLVEIKYSLPENFPAGDVQNVPGLVMKPTEQARGDALIGASVKVSEGYFWIALSSISSEMERNMGLLRERGWIDIPMLYDNGKRGILTLEKGPTGTEAVEQAVKAWQAG